MLFILSVILFGPLPTVQAADNVDDWLKENRSHSDDDLKETDKKDDVDTNTPTEDKEKELEESSDGGTSLFVVFLKMTFALLLVLGLIYVLLQLLKRKNKLFLRSNALENIGGITVGSNKSMQIVRIGSRFFVIGVGENVEILHEITDQDVVQDLLDREENNQNPTNRLWEFFKHNKEKEENGERNFKQLFSRELGYLKQNRKKIMNENKEDTHE